MTIPWPEVRVALQHAVLIAFVVGAAFGAVVVWLVGRINGGQYG